jgi:transcription elongation factor/antiterminator RfaH
LGDNQNHGKIRSMPRFSAQGGDNLRLSDRWYVVHTRPHGERRAAANLRRQDFRVFLPRHRKTVRHARQFRTVEAPFFPRYLFVRMAVGRDRWRSVNGTFGVSQLVMQGDLPKPVPSGVVEALLAIADRDGLLALDPSLRPGQSVRVVTGPFTGLAGKLVTLDERQRVQVLIDILGNPTPVAVEVSRIGLVPAA